MGTRITRIGSDARLRLLGNLHLGGSCEHLAERCCQPKRRPSRLAARSLVLSAWTRAALQRWGRRWRGSPEHRYIWSRTFLLIDSLEFVSNCFVLLFAFYVVSSPGRDVIRSIERRALYSTPTSCARRIRSSTMARRTVLPRS